MGSIDMNEISSVPVEIDDVAHLGAATVNGPVMTIEGQCVSHELIEAGLRTKVLWTPDEFD